MILGLGWVIGVFAFKQEGLFHIILGAAVALLLAGLLVRKTGAS